MAVNNKKQVLLVDDERLFLASLSEGMSEYKDEFSIKTAINGRIALEVLRQSEVHLVVTDLQMPTMDGFHLLLQMMSEFPDIPVIVMTAFCTPEIENQINELEAFDIVEKPIDLQMLASKIREALKQEADGHLKGIMLFSFLQLIELEQKTCTLQIRTGDDRGSLYFSDGTLIDAICGDLNGTSAAFEIVSWEDTEIDIINKIKKIRRRIDMPLQNILMEAAKRKDEASLLSADEPIAQPEIPLSTGSDHEDSFGNELEPIEINAEDNNPADNTHKHRKELTMANNIEHSLSQLMTLDGAMAVALVDTDSGMALGTAGGGVNLEVAAAGNTEVVKSKQKVMGSLGLKDRIDDILITLGTQYHLIRPLTSHSNLFIYLVLGREKSNLAMARFKLSEVESSVQL